jgi:hypothetical protein
VADDKAEKADEARTREESQQPQGGEGGRRDSGDPDARAEAGPRPSGNGWRGSVRAAARAAAAAVAELTGRHPEAVTAVERSGEGWKVSVEVVETERIPDTTSILATYDVALDADGDLTSYRRTRRYTRGQLRGECR